MTRTALLHAALLLTLAVPSLARAQSLTLDPAERGVGALAASLVFGFGAADATLSLAGGGDVAVAASIAGSSAAAIGFGVLAYYAPQTPEGPMVIALCSALGMGAAGMTLFVAMSGAMSDADLSLVTSVSMLAGPIVGVAVAALLGALAGAEPVVEPLQEHTEPGELRLVLPLTFVM